MFSKQSLPDSSVFHIRIQPSKGWESLQLRELWSYRELLYFLVWRDVKVRYKQTILGMLWAIIQPMMTMVVFSIFFGRLAGIPSDGIPYPIFSYAGLVPWTYFSNSMNMASNSLVTNSKIITKIYFPRLALPLAAILSALVDFMLAFIVLIGMMVFFDLTPTANSVWLPLFLLLGVMTSLGVSLWLSAMNVQFRDVRYAIPFLSQLWLFLTPVVYPSSMLDEPWRSVYALNPIVGVVEGFRWALLCTETAPGPTIGISFISALILLVSGAFYFRRMEKTFADVI